MVPNSRPLPADYPRSRDPTRVRTVLVHVDACVFLGHLACDSSQGNHVGRWRVELHRELGHPRLVRQDVAH